MKLLIFIVISIYGFKVSYSGHCLSRIESAKIGKQCSNQLKILCNRHDLLLKLWDASSKQIHNGLTFTNNQDLGNYDLCMSIDENVDDRTQILGKYCPFQWATALPKKYLEEAVAILEEYNPVRWIENNRTFKKTFQNIVKYETGSAENITLVGSICLPDGCTPDEFTKVFDPYLFPVVYNIQDPSTNCFTRETNNAKSAFEIVVTACIGFIVLVVVGATAYHIWLHNLNKDEPHDLIKAFSVLHNGKKLIAISRGNTEQIQCIHGIKFLSMLWVIAGHAFATEDSQPSFDKEYVGKWKSHLYSQYIQAGHYAVDTFFFLSGLLLAYGYMKQMKDVALMKQIKAIPLMIINRYLRLTPAIAALYFISISFFKYVADGPIWGPMLNMINGMCRKHWWRYFFYIQNYYSFSEICYIQTWYLSADMQMFVVAPIVLIPTAIYFRKNLRLVVSALLGLIIFCVGLTIAIRYLVDDYSNDYDTHSRLSNYLVGIIGGIIMHTLRGKNVKIKKIVNLFVWIMALVLMLFLILYLHDVTEHPTKDKTNLFYAIQRPIWCACILWIVFSCHHGYGGVVNKFLCYSYFQIGSRLSYCMYVVHVMVIFVNMSTVRTYQFFNDYTVFYTFCGHVVVSLVVSTLWTLTFEAPMIILNKLLLGKLDTTRK